MKKGCNMFLVKKAIFQVNTNIFRLWSKRLAEWLDYVFSDTIHYLITCRSLFIGGSKKPFFVSFISVLFLVLSPYELRGPLMYEECTCVSGKSERTLHDHHQLISSCARIS